MSYDTRATVFCMRCLGSGEIGSVVCPRCDGYGAHSVYATSEQNEREPGTPDPLPGGGVAILRSLTDKE
jgi:hypothetical protein